MTSRLSRLYARLRASFAKDRLDREVDEELATHLDLLTDENVSRGMDAQTARREARLRIGSFEAARELHRDMRSWRVAEGLARDARDAARSLRSHRSFSLAALLTMAATVAGVTVVFTLVHSVLLEPLPYPHADRLVRLTQSYADDRFASWRQVNPADFLDIQRAGNRL